MWLDRNINDILELRQLYQVVEEGPGLHPEAAKSQWPFDRGWMLPVCRVGDPGEEGKSAPQAGACLQFLPSEEALIKRMKQSSNCLFSEGDQFYPSLVRSVVDSTSPSEEEGKGCTLLG